MKRLLPFVIILAALTLAGTAAFYSVSGLAKFYAGASTAVIIMGSAIEVSKLIATSILHQYHKMLSFAVKAYLSLAIIISMAITSAGIYGFLVSAYQETAFKLEIEDGVIQTEKNRLIVFEQTAENIKTEQMSLDNSISAANDNILKLSDGLSNNVVQYTDASGNVLTTQSSSTRRILKEQLESSSIYRDTLTMKRDRLGIKYASINDSISSAEIKILQIKSNSEIAAEIGPLKYMSELTGKPMASIVNWFTLLIILIFDPLAVALVIVLNNILKKDTTKKELTTPDIKQEESNTDHDYDMPPPVNLETTNVIMSSSVKHQDDIYNEKGPVPKKVKTRNSYWTKQ